MKFFEFKDVYGTLVFINPERVTYIHEFSADQTHVYFGPDHKAMLDAQAAFVVSTLRS